MFSIDDRDFNSATPPPTTTPSFTAPRTAFSARRTDSIRRCRSSAGAQAAHEMLEIIER
jgi:hypothetical protein